MNWIDTIRRGRRLSLYLFFGLFFACASYSENTDFVREAAVHDDPASAVKELNRLLKVKDSVSMPSRWKGDAPLLVLERATLLQAEGKYMESQKNFTVVDKQLEFLDLHRDTSGQIGKYIYSDSATKYKTTPTEKLCLNAINMINFLVENDLQGARVEAKRFTIMRKYLQEVDPERSVGAIGSYLAGFVSERLGEAESALRYYDEALAEKDLMSLESAVLEISKKSSYRSERLEKYLSKNSSSLPFENTNHGEVLVVIKTGTVPYKKAVRIPIGAAVGLAHGFFTGDPKLLQYGAMKVVTYPGLVDVQPNFDQVHVEIGGNPIPVDLVSDLGQEIRDEYERVKPKIIGSALTRMIARAMVAEGARAAGNQAENAGSIVGLLAALAVEGTMVALDKPDTRSWSLLANRIFVSRATLPAGTHTVNVVVAGKGGRKTYTLKSEVKPGKFSVHDLSTLQ